jgi:HEAT repeat protein
VCGRTEALLERLETEHDPITRGNLYRLLAETAGPDVFDRLVRFTQLPDRKDRMWLLEALELIDHPRRLAAIRGAVADRDNGVASRAVRALGRMHDIEGLTAIVNTDRLYVVRSAASELARLHATSAGQPIAERMIRSLPGADPLADGDRLPFDRMGAALVRLDHVAAIEALRQAEPEQTDGRMRRIVARTASHLELIRANGSEIARWVETSKDPDLDLRRLAWSRLARIGTPEAVARITAAFDGVAQKDRLEILRVVHATPGDRVTELLRRVLLDPEFDHPHRIPLREMAAWTAARIGGPEMFELLEHAVERRDGRELRVLLYAALAGGEQAIPLLHRVRVPRMRYLGARLGLELERLDWVERRLVLGRSIAELDAPPKVVFR